MAMGTIKTKIIKIGNSQGIRIPKLLLEQTRLHDEVELALQDDRIIIQAVSAVRSGWDMQFASMVNQQDDNLLDGELLTSDWDDEEWEW